MTKISKNKAVDFFFQKPSKWKEEFNLLRDLILSCELKETLKWGKPCYTFKENNVILIHGFKNYCALLFHKGVLLKDTENILVQQTKYVQAARQLRFRNTSEIEKQQATIKAYIAEAIELEKAGLKVNFKKISDFEIPEEFQKELTNSPDLKKAFNSLTPGRQKAYLLYFSNAKQSSTRKRRIEKHTPQILKGKGLND